MNASLASMARSVFFAFLAVSVASAADEDKKPDKAKFTVSRETTWFTKPLTKSGYVNYQAALNERLRNGVTPENNAVVLLVNAFGPAPGGTPVEKPLFEEIGAPIPPEKGDYFIDIEPYLAARNIKAPDPQHAAVLDQHGRAMLTPWTARQYPEIAAWLARNEKALAIVAEAVKRPRHYTPLVTSGDPEEPAGLIAAVLPYLQSYRGVARALSIRAMLRLSERKNDAAWADLLMCHRLGRLAGTGPTLIDGLVGYSIEAVASYAGIVYLSTVRPDAKKALKCLSELDSLGPLAVMADQMDLGERGVQLDSVLLVSRGDDKRDLDLELSGVQKTLRKFGAGLIDWDPSLKLVNQWTDRNVKAMRLPTFGERIKAVEQSETDLRKFVGDVSDPAVLVGALATDGPSGVLGRTLMGVLAPSLRTAVVADARAIQRLRNLRLAFALQAYRADTGAFPKTLDALSPKYLAEIPDDFFATKPLTYQPSRDGYLLYSVGENGADDGGKSYSSNPPGDDPVVRIPVPRQ